jgi:hypothetical protein
VAEIAVAVWCMLVQKQSQEHGVMITRIVEYHDHAAARSMTQQLREKASECLGIEHLAHGSPARPSSIRTVSVSMLFSVGVSFIESRAHAGGHETHIFRLIGLRQTKSNHRIILRDRATGKMGLNDQEQRRNGNPFIILVSIGNLAAFSSKHENWRISGEHLNLCPGFLKTALRTLAHNPRETPPYLARQKYGWQQVD